MNTPVSPVRYPPKLHPGDKVAVLSPSSGLPELFPFVFEHQHSLVERKRFIDEQREAIQMALREYHPTMLTVFNLDFGHTDPQMTIPHNGIIRIDGVQRRIFATY